MPNFTVNHNKTGVKKINEKIIKKFNKKFPNWKKLSKDNQKDLIKAFCILYLYKKQNTFFQKVCRGFRKGSYSFEDTFLIFESQTIIMTLQIELLTAAFRPTNPQDANDLIAEVFEKVRLENMKKKIDDENAIILSERIEALRR